MYGYGYRYNNGLVVSAGGGAPFANTYSLDFDGIDDHLGLTTTLDLGINCTMSLWLKRDRTGTLEIYLGSSANSFAWLSYIATSNILYFKVGTTQYTFSDSPIATIMNDTTNWINICWQRSGNSLELFLNGVSMQTRTGIGTVINTTLDTIGTNANGGSGFLGNIDEVACWDTNTINPADIYNGGTPTDLSLLATPPLSWYRNGDNGSYKSPQWLIPSNENKDKVSNYSLEFDGVDDDFTCGDLSSLVDNKSKLSISFWVNLPDASEINRITGKYGGSLTKWLGVTCASNKVSFAVSNIGSSLAYAQTSAVLTDNTWHHVACIFDGTQAIATDRIKIYIDNTDETFAFNGTLPTSTYDFTLEPTNPTWYVGQAGLQLGVNELRGKLNEYSIYSDVALTDLEVNEIYNGGAPNDLNTLSVTPDLWYRMGEEATFSGGVWTVPDQVGSNDGTSNAMTIEDRVGEAPSSENNAATINMDEVDRVTDTP